MSRTVTTKNCLSPRQYSTQNPNENADEMQYEFLRLDAYGIRIEKQFLAAQAHVLPPPEVVYR
jgi:hypothetical protein